MIIQVGTPLLDGWYCRYHGQNYIPHLGNTSGPYPNQAVYTGGGTSTTGPFGYAVGVLHLTGPALQNAIWYTNHFGDSAIVDPGSATTYACQRFQEYYIVHNKIFKRDDLNTILKITPSSSDDINLAVDQQTGEYILGPYTLLLDIPGIYNKEEEVADDETINEIVSSFLHNTIIDYVDELMKKVTITKDGTSKTLYNLIETAGDMDETTIENGLRYEYEGDSEIDGLLRLIKIVKKLSWVEENSVALISFKVEAGGNTVIDENTEIPASQIDKFSTSYIEYLIDLLSKINSKTEGYEISETPFTPGDGETYGYNGLNRFLNKLTKDKNAGNDSTIKSDTFEILDRLFSGDLHSVSMTYDVKDSTMENGLYITEKDGKITFYVPQFGDISKTSIQEKLNEFKESAITRYSTNNAVKILYHEILGSIDLTRGNNVSNSDGYGLISYPASSANNGDTSSVANEDEPTPTSYTTIGPDGDRTLITNLETHGQRGNNNQTKSNTFAYYFGVMGLDAQTHKVDVEGDGLEEEMPDVSFIGEDGEEILFPDFTTNNNKFYLRYKPKQNNLTETTATNIDNIISYTTGQPSIKLGFLKDTGTTFGSRYELTEIKWTGITYAQLLSLGATVVLGNPVTWTPYEPGKGKNTTGEYKKKQKFTTEANTVMSRPATITINAVSPSGNIVGTWGPYDITVARTITLKRTVKEVKVTHDTYDNAGNVNGSYTRYKYEIGNWNYKNLLDPVLNLLPGSYECTLPESIVINEFNQAQTTEEEPTFTPAPLEPSVRRFFSEYHIDLSMGWVLCEPTGPGKDINVKIGGTVWFEGLASKGSSMSTPGRQSFSNETGDQPFEGVEVELFEENALYSEHGGITDTSQFASKAKTKTKLMQEINGDGSVARAYAYYSFEHLNPLKKYYVKFRYNGMLYQPTYYKYNLQNRLMLGDSARDYSNAQEINTDRTALNNTFGVINATTFGNYDSKTLGKKNTAYGLNTVLRSDSGGVAKIIDDGGERDLIFGDVWNWFLEELKKADNTTELILTSGSKFYNDLSTYHIENKESIIAYIADCMITSQTLVASPIEKGSTSYNPYDYIGNNELINYPVYDRFTAEELDLSKQASGTQTNDGSVITFRNYHGTGADVNFMDLYTKNSDQSRFVSFGLTDRITTDVAISKDVYKVSLIVNGKLEEYIYSKKDLDNEGIWNVPLRREDFLYNGGTNYIRDIRSSEYLYATETNTGEKTKKRDLQAYVTYRISVKNQGGTIIGDDLEIVDYYDNQQFILDTSDGTASGTINSRKVARNDGTVSNESYLTSYATRAGIDPSNVSPTNITSDPHLTIKDKSSNNEDIKFVLSEGSGDGKKYRYDYESLYLSGFGQVLNPDEWFSVFLTFKVKLNTVSGKIKLDQNISVDGTDRAVDEADFYKFGKRNIAEIYKYSTTYHSDNEIPSYLDSGDNPQTATPTGYAGIVDIDSKPGSLCYKPGTTECRELNNEGQLIRDYSEDDEDQSPNLKFIIPSNGDGGNDRTINGQTFEDARNIASGQASVGNGAFNAGDGDVLINGVTVELVELVTDVDDNAISNGTYLYEHTWGSYTYDTIVAQPIDTGLAGGGPELVAVVGMEDTTRYSSGTTNSKIIMNGPKGTVFYIEPSTPEFGANQGQYGFDAFPAGDYIVRFRYGDHFDTILTNDPKNEVYQLLTNGDPNSTYSGKNKKSYNGQDFKSTVYQAGVSQGSVTQYHPGSVDDGTGKNIDGFVRFEDSGGVTAQNYRNHRADTDNENIDGNKGAFVANYQKMYSYDIDLSESASNVSDAKDVYKYRDKGLAYAGTLTNHNSEVLDSFEKLATTDYPIWYKYTDSSGKTSSLTSEYIKYLGSDDRVKNELSITDAKNEVDFNKISSVEVIIPDKDGETANKDALINKQKGMIEELKENAQQMAQSGVINVNIEKNKSLTTVGDISFETYELGGIDFGVAERPEAQLLLNKEVDKLKFTLTNGSTLFETQGPAADLIFTKHSSHDAKYEAHKLKSVNRTINKKLFPEIIQGYIDEEVLNGATIEVTYKFSLRNVGEVDYNGLRFYYTGTGQNTSSTAEVTRTKADYIIDYISKDLKYTDQKQIDSDTWKSISKDELVPSHNNPSDTTHDLINSVYYDELASYGDSNLSYMITDKLSGTSDGKAGLLPEALNVGASSVGPIYMVLTTNSSFYDVNSTYTYNNLCEVIQISNDQGRRMQYSITGNQPMADQETKNNAVYEEDNKNYSRIQLVTPSEVDADSAQQILFIPPTGEDRDYTLVTLIAVSAATIVAVGYIIVRRSLMAREKAKIIK